MTNSMTAFARQEVSGPMGQLVCELRSVNHRYLDFHCRLSDELRSIEPRLRERVAGRLKRGRVDCSFRFVSAADSRGEFEVNEAILEKVLVMAGQMQQKMPQLANLNQADVLRWPGVVGAPEIDREALSREALDVFEAALAALTRMRAGEGEQLGQTVRERLAAMRRILEEIRGLLPDIVRQFRQRMEEKLAQVREQLDADRLEQEMVLFQQKSDVMEEIDRLALHIDGVEQTLKRREPVGRRLDFLMQELNREANTLSSKSTDVRLTNHAVELKVLIEQMREQVQNIE